MPCLDDDYTDNGGYKSLARCIQDFLVYVQLDFIFHNVAIRGKVMSFGLNDSYKQFAKTTNVENASKQSLNLKYPLFATGVEFFVIVALITNVEIGRKTH